MPPMAGRERRGDRGGKYKGLPYIEGVGEQGEYSVFEGKGESISKLPNAAMGMQNGPAAVGNSLVAPQEVKHRIAIWPSNHS